MNNKIAIFHDGRDLLCATLTGLGFSARYVQEKTGLSFGQIYYRNKRVGVKASDYRNGKSRIAKFVTQQATNYAQREIEHRIRALLPASE